MRLFIILAVAVLALIASTPAFGQIITVAAHNPTKGEQNTYETLASPMAKEIRYVQFFLGGLQIDSAKTTLAAIGYRLVQIDNNICVVSKIDGQLKLVGTIEPTKEEVVFIQTLDTLTFNYERTITTEPLAINTLQFMVGDSLEYLEVKHTYSQFAGVVVITVDSVENTRRGVTSAEVKANQPHSATSKKESQRAESRRAAELISKGHDLADWYLSDFLLPYDLNYRSCSKSSLTGERTIIGATIGNILDAISYPVRLIGKIYKKSGQAKKQALKDKSFARTTSK